MTVLDQREDLTGKASKGFPYVSSAGSQDAMRKQTLEEKQGKDNQFSPSYH